MNPITVLAFGLPGGMEWIIVLVIGLLLFGRRLPEIMRGLGGGVREFRKGIEGEADRADQAASRVQDRPQEKVSADTSAEEERVKTAQPADSEAKSN